MNPFLNKNSIYFGNNAYVELSQFIDKAKISKIFVLIDDNTKVHCFPYFKTQVNFDFKVVEIQHGELNKTLDTCQFIWKELSHLGADRKSLLINLGGGVVTDIGGFVASCYRRGISFLHVPTTLLGMVDAAIGGKTGVDLMNLKNQIGVINQPEMILYDFDFLSTLPLIELKSGFAEVLKHGLIHSKRYVQDCLDIKTIHTKSVIPLIEESIEIKQRIVLQDTQEHGLRKALNYGHTLGHAIETFRMGLEQSMHLLHGEAIAIGLVLETYLSKEIFGFPEDDLMQLKKFVNATYNRQFFSKDDQREIIALMKFDKKNVGNNINFVLLEDIGRPRLDCKVDNDLIYKAFEYYLS